MTDRSISIKGDGTGRLAQSPIARKDELLFAPARPQHSNARWLFGDPADHPATQFHLSQPPVVSWRSTDRISTIGPCCFQPLCRR